MLKQYLEAGRIVGTHGIRGEMRVDVWCDSPDFLSKMKTLYFDDGKTPLKVLAARVHKSQVLLLIDGVDTVEKADVLRGRTVYIDRENAKLPEGRWFIQDLIGLSVLDADSGTCYGTLTDVLKTGANDVYEVKDSKGKYYYVPVIESVLISASPEKGEVRIRPMGGIFDED